MTRRTKATHRHLPLLAALCAAAALPAAAAPDGRAEEAQVVAALAYNILKFVEWEPRAPARASPTLELCVLADEGLAGAASAALAGRSIGGRSLRVRAASDVAACGGCAVVFVGGDGSNDVERAAFLLADAGAVTFSRAARSGASGVVFSFHTDGEKVQFEVNLAAARRAHVKVSSKLLALARVVGEDAR